MDQATRQRALRIIAAALLGSEFSNEELRDIATLLQRDRRFSMGIARICRDITLDDDDRKSKSSSRSSKNAPSEWISSAESAMKQKRLAKRELLAAMSALNPSLSRESFGSERTSRDLLRAFEEASSHSMKDQLLQWLHSPSAIRDEYIEGILRK